MSKLSLLFYEAGMCGDFLCVQVHKSQNYEDINAAPKSYYNRYFFPHKMFSGIDLHKNMSPTKEVITTIKNTQIENNFKNICLPKHKYHHDWVVQDFPEIDNFIRITTKQDEMIRLAHACYLIKSPYYSFDPRIQDRNPNTPEHPAIYRPEKEHYKHNLIKNGIEYFNIEDLIYGDKDRSRFEDLLECKLDYDIIDEYAEENLRLVSSEEINIYDEKQFKKTINEILKYI